MQVLLFLNEHLKSNSYFIHTFLSYSFLNRMLKIGESDETRVAQLEQQLSDKLDVYDKILSKQPYLAGQVIERFM